MINASNPEHLPVFKVLRDDSTEQNVGTIHASNPEQLPVFKAQYGNDLEQNAGTIHAKKVTWRGHTYNIKHT